MKKVEHLKNLGRWMTLKVDLEKKQKITEAAKELFFRFGFSKTSMDDIAVQSGMAKPTLYYYYDNKEAIFKQRSAACGSGQIYDGSFSGRIIKGNKQKTSE